MPQAPAATALVTPREACLRLMGLSLLCGALYRLSNQLSAQRGDTAGGVLAWDHAIPFVDWTVWPYLSIVLPFTASFIVGRDRAALDRHSRSVLLALALALACYALVPLRFAFERPPTDGLTGALFAGLGAFDLPYNRAPSLHIAVLVLLWARLAPLLRSGWPRHLLASWFLLIGGSVLTTWQHHLIDVPAGLAVGLLSLALSQRRPQRPLQASAWLASTSARTASVSSAFRPAKTGVVFTE
jgi:membrane-associated phospholipid phosphatase